MSSYKKICIVLLLSMVMINVVIADMYLHNPPGSNDRNRERRENRNNGNRLFDSQNNNKGGYPWRGDPTFKGKADPLTYYTHSVLRVEWTNQHSCGTNPNLACDVVIQVGCDQASQNLVSSATTMAPVCANNQCRQMPGIRDGYPTSNNLNSKDGFSQRQFVSNGAGGTEGTNRIPEGIGTNTATEKKNFFILGATVAGQVGKEYGMHESYLEYDACKTTKRNGGLYTADQTLKRSDARATRQNPNGNRRGLECPEERDYYPYWNSQINRWRDVAVLTNNAAKCEYFKSRSANVQPYGFCTGVASPRPITSQECSEKGGSWNPGYCTTQDCLTPPECIYHAYGRDNHLGNSYQVDEEGNFKLSKSKEPETAHYLWTVPDDLAGQRCVLRLRYNMTGKDFPGEEYALNPPNIGIDSSKNCPRFSSNAGDTGNTAGDNSVDLDQNGVPDNVQCTTTLSFGNRPLYNRPFIDYFQDGVSPYISIALNTNQNGRTFQDRSYVFDVAQAPTAEKIFNLNVRGRRGNIVQAYPAVEYDFVPSYLEVDEEDYIHIQFHGSDFNTNRNRNNGEGNEFTDRFNMIQLADKGHNIMPHIDNTNLWSDRNLALRWALLEQDPNLCLHITKDNAADDNKKFNCAKLNLAPNRYPQDPLRGMMQAGSQIGPGGGTYHYVSTRNNNLSNRSQKGTLVVFPKSGLTAAQIAGISVGVSMFVLLAIAGLCYFGMRNPHTRLGHCYSNSVGKWIESRKGGTSLEGTRSHAVPPDMTYTRHI